MDKQHERTKKKAFSSIAAIAVLFGMLALTTYALIASFVSVDDHLFQTGTVEIQLNGGRAVFDGSDMNVEPGHSLVREFTVENKGSAAVYYRIYLENVSGALQEALSFEIYDGDKLLFCGTAEEWTKEASCVSDTPLAAGETRRLTAVVRMEETAGNLYQGGDITFDMTADAVQSKNNPDKSFE